MTTGHTTGRLSRRAKIAGCLMPFGMAASITLIAAPAENSHWFPKVITLPADFVSEGIAVGRGFNFYVGSFASPQLGQILVGDLRTGEYSELVPASGRPAVGMKVDRRTNYLYVAGGNSGGGTVYDADSGAELGFYSFLPPDPGTIVNDVTLTREAAYFTVATRPFLGRVHLNRRGEPVGGETIELPENFGVRGSCTLGPGVRSNGIASTPDGTQLILAHTSEGTLYLLDTEALVPEPIVIAGGDSAGGQALCAADGLWLDGRTLYVVQFGPLHRIAVVKLSRDYRYGVIAGYITEPFASDPAIQFPTTIAEFGPWLYGVTYGQQPPSPDVVFRVRKRW